MAKTRPQGAPFRSGVLFCFVDSAPTVGRLKTEGNILIELAQVCVAVCSVGLQNKHT